MATYEICGTCSISYSENEDEIEIMLFPANGYLSPCKNFAVLYPADKSSEALLHKIDDDNHKKCSVGLFISKGAPIFSIIAQAAATQQKIKFFVEQRIEESVEEKDQKRHLTVVKCLFPAP